MQVQKSHCIGHSGPAATDLNSNIFLPHSKFVSQPRVALSFFDWVEIGALQIFDQRKFEDFQVVSGSDNGWNGDKTKFLRGAPPSLAGDQFKSRADLAYDERLNNAVLPNRFDQFE